MSTTYADPHWYTTAGHFRDGGRHHQLLEIVRRTCNQQLRGTPDAGQDALVHRSALEHYLTTYGSPDLPPSWLVVETLTIGQRLYPVLVSLQAVLDSVSPRSSWAQRLERLLSARPRMNLDGMGVPEGWAGDPFWSRNLA